MRQSKRESVGLQCKNVSCKPGQSNVSLFGGRHNLLELGWNSHELLTQSLVGSNCYAVLSDHGYHWASIIFHYRLSEKSSVSTSAIHMAPRENSRMTRRIASSHVIPWASVWKCLFTMLWKVLPTRYKRNVPWTSEASHWHFWDAQRVWWRIWVSNNVILSAKAVAMENDWTWYSLLLLTNRSSILISLWLSCPDA